MRVKDELCDKKVATLARKLEISDTYVHRMLYPEGKKNKKNIGEVYVDLVLEKIGVDLDEEATGATDNAPKLFYHWISQEESRLISDFRTASPNGRRIILDSASQVEKIITPASSENKG